MERQTKQRFAIRRVFEACPRPLSPQEVLDAAQEYEPKLGIATVYRTLKVLVEEGWLVHVELPGAPPRYEQAGKKHHHHFHCRECEKVFEIEGCPGDLRRMAPNGFKLERHELTLYGLCNKCSA